MFLLHYGLHGLRSKLKVLLSAVAVGCKCPSPSEVAHKVPRDSGGTAARWDCEDTREKPKN